jgi:hypothetical protein
MKASTSLSLFSLALFSLTGCQKDAKALPDNISINSVAVIAASPDSIPDKAYFKIKLVKDSMNYDETAFVFDHTAGIAYDNKKDALYLAGFGQESLSSLSGDGRELAIYRLPYTRGMSIRLNINSKTDNKFYLETSYQNSIPVNIQIWLKDTFLKDSVNIRSVKYNFNVSIADTNSFGNKRFKIIVKEASQQ